MVRVWPGLAMVLVLAGAWGCGDTDCVDCPPDEVNIGYSEAATPQEVIEDLEIAYRRREIEPYAALLSAEFTFLFTGADAQGLPKDFYTQSEDSIATANLFRGIDLGGTGGNVMDIKIDLTTLPAEAATLEEYPGDEIQLVRVISTFLDVNLDNGWTLRVSGDQQLFYFRLGKPDLGESPGRWYLVQWQDLGGLGAKPGAGAPAVEGTTWGGIKKMD